MSNHQELPSNKKNEHPDWLKALERESWQPELLISGLAIFAAIQFPTYIGDVQDYMAFNFDKEVFGYGVILTSYLNIASYAIAINFSIHFILRVFWIGVLGLMSVYPEGIKFEKYPYGGTHFVGKLRKKLASLKEFSLQLDRICSIIFSLSALIVLSLVSACILVSSILGLSLLVKFLLPNYYDDHYNGITMMIFGGIILFFSVILALFNYTKLKYTSFAEKYHFPIYWTFSTVVFNVLNRPFHYISLTFSTNNLAGKMNIALGVYIVLLSSILVLNAKMQHGGIETRQFYGEKSNAFALNPMSYDNLRPEYRYVTRPSIPSDVIEGKFLKLFIPYPKRLEEKLKKVCKEVVLKKEDPVSDFQHGRLQNEAYLECFERFYQVYVNEELWAKPSWQFYKHPNKEEDGIISYLPTDSLLQGKNVLRIEEWKVEEEEEQKIYEIPFWF